MKKGKVSKLVSMSLIMSLVMCSTVLAGEVEFSPKGMDIEVAFPTTGLHTDANASTFVDSDVTYAVNGGFFDAYYNTASGYSYPSNAPRVFGPIIQDGELINGGFTHNMVGFTSNGDVLIDRVTVTPLFYRNGSSEGSQIWVTNQLYTDGYSVSLMTDDFKGSFTVPTGATTVTVSNGVVTNINTSSTQQVASGTSMLVFNSERVDMLRSYNAFLSVGDKISYGVDYEGMNNGNWDNVETAITGGKILILNGQNVSADNSVYNTEFVDEANQSSSVSAARTYLGVKSDGTIILGTTTGTFTNITADLLSKGCINAISLDGGASSMLYANGSFLTSAGRNLASILTFTGTPSSSSVYTPVVETEPVVEIEPVVSSNVTAQYSASTVLVDGVEKGFESYLIDGSNYFKLRDIAEVVNGTDCQFSVAWDSEKSAITLFSSVPYVGSGSISEGDGVDKIATISNSVLYCDDVEQSLDAYTIEGNTYFKLRDLGTMLGFSVGWNGEQGVITIDTK